MPQSYAASVCEALETLPLLPGADHRLDRFGEKQLGSGKPQRGAAQDELETEAGDHVEAVEEESEAESSRSRSRSSETFVSRKMLAQAAPVAADLGSSLTSSLGGDNAEEADGPSECDILRQQLNVALQALDEMEAVVVSAQQRATKCEAKAAKVPLLCKRITELENQLAERATNLPLVRMSDIGEEAKHIRVYCPGADEDSIDILGLPNGVRLQIGGVADCYPDFVRDFVFDHSECGHYELRMDECTLENGVLLLVLKRAAPQRMKLRRASNASQQRLSLVPIAENSRNVTGKHGCQSEQDDITDGYHTAQSKPETFVLSTPCIESNPRKTCDNSDTFAWPREISGRSSTERQQNPQHFLLTPACAMASCDDAVSEVTSQQWLDP